MLQMTESELLRKPEDLLVMMTLGTEITIVTQEGRVLGTVLSRPSPESGGPPPDMKAWARDIEVRLKQQFGSRVVPDSAPLLEESRYARP